MKHQLNEQYSHQFGKLPFFRDILISGIFFLKNESHPFPLFVFVYMLNKHGTLSY